MAEIRSVLLLFTCFLTSIVSRSILPDIFVDEIVKEDDWRWLKASEVIRDEDNEYISKTANGFSISNNCFGVSLKCQAPYPIYWTIDKVEELTKIAASSINTYTVRNGSIEESTGKPSYEAVLKLWIYDVGLTRNYTCRSDHDEQLQASSFLFIQDVSQNYLVNAGKTLEIGVDDKSVLEVPCGVTTEDVEVILSKEEVSHPFNVSTWRKFSTNASITYDPQRGFSLKVADSLDILGLYKCTIDENEDDVVHINIDSISPIPDPDQETYHLRSSIHGSAKIEYDYITDTVVCCSNSDKKPTMQLMSCANAAECEISKHIILSKLGNKKDEDNIYQYYQDRGLSSNCTRGYLFLPTFWVRCKGDGIDVLSQFYYSFKTTNVRLDQLEQSMAYYRLPKAYEIVPVTQTVPLENLVFVTYNRISATDIQSLNNDNNVDIFYMKYRSYEDMAYDDGIMYSGQALAFHCYYSGYVLSEGAYWEFLWQNRTKNRIYGKSVSEPYLMGAISVGLILDDKIRSVSCHAGVWNSTEWSSKYVNLTVHAPVAPLINGPEVVKIYLAVNETNATLECSFSGKPLPNKVSWQKDGKVLRLTEPFTVEQRNNNTSVLKISKVTHDIHGEYSCSGNNLVSTVVKTFIVFVEEEGGLGGFGTVAVILTVLTVGGYLLFILWKTRFHQRMVQNMSSSTYQLPT